MRGYGYVAASRFKSKEGLFHYGKIRRTDWLPVGEGDAEEQLERGYDSWEEDAFEREYKEELNEQEEAYANSEAEDEEDDDDQRLGYDASMWGADSTNYDVEESGIFWAIELGQSRSTAMISM